MSEIKELVETMVLSIIDEEERFQITEEKTESGILYEITVSKDDVGKLIGRGGRVASSLRTIAKASGAKHGVRVFINVMKKPLQ